MAGFRNTLFGAKFLRIAALATAGLGLSGCYSTFGGDYHSAGYSAYDCDPYSPFDSYYDCDYGYGFSNIGYGGGWYDSYWYPGYGFYLFDNYGHRYPMRANHRRYWGERRHHWYRENRGRNNPGGQRNSNDDGNRGSGGYTNPAPRGEGQGRGNWRRGNQEQNQQGDGQRRHIRNGQPVGGQGVNAIPVPAPRATPAPGRGDYGRRGGDVSRRRLGGNDQAGAVNVPRAALVMPGRGERNQGRSGSRNYRQQAQDNNARSVAPTAMPVPRGDDSPAPRRRGRGNPDSQPD
ncbi:MAG: hypothetical protein ABI668_10025 [Sphingorhabdus sp.]